MEPTQMPGQGNMGGGMNQGAPMGAPTPAPMMNMNQGGGDAMENKGVAVVSRIPILFWVPFLSAPKSPFAMFHANQGLLHLITHFALTIILPFIPILGWIALPFVQIGSLIFLILGMIQASKGEMKPLPIIGGYKLLN